MKKQFYSKLLFLFALLLTMSTSAWADEVTYVFTSKSWAATVNNSAANWTSGQDGGQLTQGQGIQVTTGASGANGTSPESFSNISKIVVRYCTNASKGAGAIKVQVGSGEEKSFSVTKPSSGGTTLKNAEFTFNPSETGAVKITAECTQNSVYIYSVTITYTPSGGESTKEANDLTLNATEKTFDLKNGDGQTFQLSNSGDADGALSYASNNGAVATVSDTGLITVVGEGTATITVTQAASETYEGGSATCVVTVTDSRYIVSDLTFDAQCGGSGIADNGAGAAWTVTSDGAESNFDNNKGIHYGTKNNAVKYIQLNSSDFSGIIQKVVVNASTAKEVVGATVAVTVGGEAFGGNPKDITQTATDYTFTGSASGEIVVTVTKEESATYALYVKSVKVYYIPSRLASIAVDVTNAPTQFHQGDDFSHEGAKVTATYENKTTKDVTNVATFTGYDMSAEGDQTVTVSYTEGEVTKTDTYTINVAAPATLTGITLSGNCPTEFEQGDAFSYEGLVVTANYSDDTSADVTDEADFSGYDMSALGEQTVTVSYQGKTQTYNITIVEKRGTADNPYTVAQARAAIAANEGVTVEGVYATGIVSEIVTAYSTQYKNISYNISVDGEPTGDQLQAFRGKNFKGANFTSDNDIKVGDKVVIYGNLKKYGQTYEFDSNNQLVSLERANFITDAANATWVAPAKVKVLSEGVTVYTVTYDDVVGCTRKHVVTDKVIPANEAVLLTSNSKGAATVKIAVTADEAADFAALDNDLQGSDGTVWGDTNIFCLADGAKGLGFYPVDSSIQVPAGKAYLEINLSDAQDAQAEGAPQYLWFNDDTTAIDSLTTDTAAGNESGEIYSLTGQRVGKNYRGIVIMNGRKVLKK